MWKKRRIFSSLELEFEPPGLTRTSSELHYLCFCSFSSSFFQSHHQNAAHYIMRDVAINFLLIKVEIK